MSDRVPVAALSRRQLLLALTGAILAGPPQARSRLLAADDDARRVRFGVQTWSQGVSWKDLATTWQEIEELGFDSAFVFDHFMAVRADPKTPVLDGWTLLSALATKTSRMHIGLLVTGNTYRHPAVLAKMAATVDHLSGGRVILGLGAGWYEPEHVAYGIPFRTTGGRARRLAEAVEVVKLLFTKERASFQGRYYRLSDAPLAPKPLQKPHPPILVGGMGPKVIQPLAARHADIWHFSRQEPDEAKELIGGFDLLCREAGRDPAAVSKAMSFRDIEVGKWPAEKIRDRVRAFVAAGIDYFVLSTRPPYDRALLRRFAREVVPEFRGTRDASS